MYWPITLCNYELVKSMLTPLANVSGLFMALVKEIVLLCCTIPSQRRRQLQTLCPKVLALPIRGRLHDDTCRFHVHPTIWGMLRIMCQTVQTSQDRSITNTLISLTVWTLIIILGLYVVAHCYWSYIYIYIYFFFFSYVFNSSSLFMSISKLIWININIMDMKRHMLHCLLVSMLVGKKNEWDS